MSPGSGVLSPALIPECGAKRIPFPIAEVAKDAEDRRGKSPQEIALDRLPFGRFVVKDYPCAHHEEHKGHEEGGTVVFWFYFVLFVRFVVNQLPAKGRGYPGPQRHPLTL